MQLVIGNKNYSSWSLRPWLLLTGFGLEFEEQWVSLQEPNLSQRLLEFSGSARVPVLNDNGLSLWDSLAICEYLNEQHLDGRAWPLDAQERAIARAVVAEMHSGFLALRTEMPMNCRASRIIKPSDACLNDIARIDEIWREYARTDEAGNVRLFGRFGIADCMFAPVVMRFSTYLPDVSVPAQAYMQSMRAHPGLKQWLEAAIQETEVVDVDEAGTER